MNENITKHVIGCLNEPISERVEISRVLIGRNFLCIRFLMNKNFFVFLIHVAILRLEKIIKKGKYN